MSIKDIKRSLAFDTYWRFACERQDIFIKRVNGEYLNLTSDNILQKFKFTNAYRASDRVSQYLIKSVIYKGSYNAEDTVFRVLLFKLFNKIETWELLESKFGEISVKEFSLKHYSQFLNEVMENGTKIYSNAYMMASSAKEFSVKRKHHAHLMLLEMILKDRLPQKIQDSKSMLAAYNLLLSYPMIGRFLAYQYVTDINYSEVTNFSECEFTMPGPGAKDGIKKCFESTGNMSGTEIIQYMTDIQEQEFERLGLKFQFLGGRRLQYIDIQNIFCETDKYCRVAHPELLGYSGRTRIKQKFKPNKNVIDIFFPPKWKLRNI